MGKETLETALVAAMAAPKLVQSAGAKLGVACTWQDCPGAALQVSVSVPSSCAADWKTGGIWTTKTAPALLTAPSALLTRTE